MQHLWAQAAFSLKLAQPVVRQLCVRQLFLVERVRRLSAQHLWARAAFSSKLAQPVVRQLGVRQFIRLACAAVFDQRALQLGTLSACSGFCVEGVCVSIQEVSRQKAVERQNKIGRCR